MPFLKGRSCLLQIIDSICSQSCEPAGKARIVAVPPEQRAAIEKAIMDAFLTGSDDNFDQLLEVIPTPPHLHRNFTRDMSVILSPKSCNARHITVRRHTHHQEQAPRFT